MSNTNFVDGVCLNSDHQGLLSVPEDRLEKLIKKDPITNVYHVEHTPFARSCMFLEHAATERVFYLMNSLWTSDKTQLGVETLKAMLITKVNYEETCVEFFKMLLRKKDLLKKIHSSERGKFAAVRKCTHKETGVEYAAKFIRKRRRAMDQRQDILHEIAVLKIAATSSRIVHLHEVYETSTEMVLILEMAAGGELQRVLDLEEGLEEQQAVKMMRQILEGLSFLHNNNIAHLDLKPQNLLLTATYPDCDIKLCDFGISRVIQNGIEVREIIGTPDYVAPEILSYEPISLATDIWSVGILAYVLLSGYSPFGGDSKQETFCNISQCCLSFPDDLFDGVSSAAKDFIQMTLIKEPSNRLTIQQCLEHPWLSRIVEKPSQVCTRSQNKVKTPYIVSTTDDNDQLPVHKRPKNSSDDKCAYPVASCLSCSQCGSQCCQLHATQRQHHHSSISISPVEITVDRGIIC